MVIPRTFSNERERILANYDFIEIASGLGFVNYYGMTSALGTGKEYILSDRIEMSYVPVESRTSAGTTTLTFDSSEFNLPRTAKGNAIFTVGLATSGTTEPTLTVQLKKWDGSTATNISSVITSVRHQFPGGNDDVEFLLQIPLTETIIRKGEQLRLVVTFQTEDNNLVEMGTDPAGRDGTLTFTEGTSVMKLSMPFKIDL